MNKCFDYLHRNECLTISKLATPIVIGQIGQVLIGAIDNIMIGKYSTLSLAASGFALSINTFFLFFAVGMVSSLSPLIAQAYGASNYSECSQYMIKGIWVALIAFLATTIGQTACFFFLDSFGQPPEVVAEAKSYYLTLMFSFLPMLLFLVLRQFSEGVSRTQVAMYGTLVGLVVNVVANYVLIYGKLGVPELGLVGAGIGSLISRTCMFLFMLFFIYFDKGFRSLFVKTDRLEKSAHNLAHIFRLAVPLGLISVFEISAFSGAAIMAGWVGVKELAAHNIAFSLGSVSFMFILGLSNAGAIRVGYKKGKSDIQGIKTTTVTIYIMTLLVMAVFASLVIIFRENVSALFVKDSSTIQIASAILIVAALFQLFDGIQVVASGLLRGLLKVKVPMFISFCSYWIVALPMGYFFMDTYNLGVVGIWFGLLLGLMFASVVLSFYLKNMISALVTTEATQSNSAMRIFSSVDHRQDNEEESETNAA